MEHIQYFKSLLSLPSNIIMSELRCHGNLLMSSKTVPLRQVLVVRTSIIQISDTLTSFLLLRFLWVIFFIICHHLSLPCGIHSKWRISLRFLSGDFSLPLGISIRRLILYSIYAELDQLLVNN